MRARARAGLQPVCDSDAQLTPVGEGTYRDGCTRVSWTKSKVSSQYCVACNPL